MCIFVVVVSLMFPAFAWNERLNKKKKCRNLWFEYWFHINRWRGVNTIREPHQCNDHLQMFGHALLVYSCTKVHVNNACAFFVVVVCVWLVVVTFFVVLTILPLEIPSCHFFHFVQCALCAASDSANFILLPVLCLIGNHHCLAEAIHVWGGLGRCICVHLLIFEHNNIQIFDRKHHLTSLSIRVFRFLAGENIYYFFFQLLSVWCKWELTKSIHFGCEKWSESILWMNMIPHENDHPSQIMIFDILQIHFDVMNSVYWELDKW